METIDNRPQVLSSPVTREVIELPELVRRGLARCKTERHRARTATMLHHTAANLAWVARTYRREVQWWRVLFDWVYSAQGAATNSVFGTAAIAAQTQAEDLAEEYERFAADAAARSLGVTPGGAA